MWDVGILIITFFFYLSNYQSFDQLWESPSLAGYPASSYWFAIFKPLLACWSDQLHLNGHIIMTHFQVKQTLVIVLYNMANSSFDDFLLNVAGSFGVQFIETYLHRIKPDCEAML